MPLYVADYLADTAHLGALESGAYLHLIMHYWIAGGLPDQPRELARIAKVSAHSWKKISPVIQKFFHDGWRHKRIEAELAKAYDISEKRRSAANKRHDKPDANASANADQMHPHSQSQSQERGSSAFGGIASDASEITWKQVYEFANKVLGGSAGGLVMKLRRHFGEDPKATMAALNEAVQTGDARHAIVQLLEYYG